MIDDKYEQFLKQCGTHIARHSGRSLYDHFLGTHDLLVQWGASRPLSLAGLFHSLYGTQWYRSEVLPLKARKDVREVLGELAEDLVFWFCAIDRTLLWKQATALDVVVVNRFDGSHIVLSSNICAQLRELDAANIVDQALNHDKAACTIAREYSRTSELFVDSLSAGARDALARFKQDETLAAPSESAPVSSGVELAELLAPISPELFVNHFFGRRSLLVGGKADKFGALFSLKRLKQLLDDNRSLSVTASYDRGRTHVPIKACDAMRCFDSGATVCVTNLAAADDNLALFANSIRQQLGFCGFADFRAYLSPDGEGYDLHFDERIATTLQIEGKKHWRYSADSALPWPHYQVTPGVNQRFSTSYQFHDPPESWEVFRTPDSCHFETAILGPGDLLCLPAGAWHSAEGEGYSLALNLAFVPYNFWNLLAPLIQSTVVKQIAWREAIPCAFGDRLQLGVLPKDVEMCFRERISDLVTILNTLSERPTELEHLWRRRIVFGNEGLSPGTVTCSSEVLRNSRLRVSNKRVTTVGRCSLDGRDAVALYSSRPNVELYFGSEASEFFRRMLIEKNFTAVHSLAWTPDESSLDWESVSTILKQLVSLGILELL